MMPAAFLDNSEPKHDSEDWPGAVSAERGADGGHDIFCE